MHKSKHINGFSLIETVLSISIFLVTIIVLLAMVGPVMTSLDDVKESVEVSTIVESLNSFLQSDSGLAANSSNFDLIYEAVKSRGYATIYIYRSFYSPKSANLQLSIGFSARETTSTVKMRKNAKIYNFKNAAGPIYRAILTCGPRMPKKYYRDRGRTSYPRYFLTSSLKEFKNNFLTINISLYANDQDLEYIDKISLKDILNKKPIVRYNSVINR